MKTVELVMSRQNERLLSRVLIDGRACRDSRLNSYMIDRPINEWLHESTTRYAVWKGLLQELSCVLNSHAFSVKFQGTPSAYSEFKKMIEAETVPDLHVAFEFCGHAENDNKASNGDEDFLSLKECVRSFISLAEDKYLRRRINVICNSLGDSRLNINLNILHDDNFGSFTACYSFIRLFRVDFADTNMPAVLSCGEKLSVNLHEISQLHGIPLQDIIVLSAMNKYSDSLAQQLKTSWPCVNLIRLSGNAAEDSQELTRITLLYRSYFVRKLRELLEECTKNQWNDIEAVDSLMKKLR